MKRFSFCLAILLIFCFGVAHAQLPGQTTFIKLGSVTIGGAPAVNDTLYLTADAEVKFPIIYGNRDTIRYNTSNAFIIFSDADGVLEPDYYTHRGDGTATWAFATANGGNVKGLGTGKGMWIDTSGFYHKFDFPSLFKFSLFSADGAGADTVQFSGAGGLDDTGYVTEAAHRQDSGVFMTMRVLAKVADAGKYICIDSSAKYPPSGTWKWPAFALDTAAHIPSYNVFPTWSGAKCYVLINPNAPTNKPPVLNPIGSQNINEGVNLTVIATATDPDGTTPSLSASPLPTGASFTDNLNGSGTFSWTPGFNQAGPYDVTFIASDGKASDTEIVHITVNNVNRAPVLDAIGPKAVAEAANLNFTVTGSDLDGGTLTFGASPLPTGATFNASTGVFDWTPTYDQAGPYDVLFTISDGTLADSEMVTITVTNVNRPPVLAAIGAKNVQVGQTLNFGVSATDPDATTPTLSATALTNATFTDNTNGTGSFSFTPDAGQVGPQQVTFTASDGDLTDDEVVTITVEPKSNYFVFSKDTLTYTATINTNPPTQAVNITKGGDTELEYNATSAATWITLSNATGTTPADLFVGINTAGLVVTPSPYHDSVQVAGAGVSSKWIQVYLTITACPEIRLSKTAFADTIFVGESASVSDSIDVTSTGVEINFAAQASAGFTFPKPSGITPGKVSFVFDELFSAAGSFQRCFTVLGSSTDVEIPCPSQAQVCVSIVVKEKPCVTIHTSDSLLEFTAVQGDAIATPNARVFTVSSSDAERNFAFDVNAPIGNDWVYFDSTGGTSPFSGTTPAQVPVQVRPGTLGVGPHYIDIVVSSQSEEVCVPKLKVMTVFVNVTRRPSADTVRLANVPAVRGQTVEFPVYFVNSCPLQSLEVMFNFNPTFLHLSGVSYAGSRIEYVASKNAVIDNETGTVKLTADVGAQSQVPVGSGTWANLMFVVRPEAPLDYYPITLADCDCDNPLFVRDCGNGNENQVPEFVSELGGIQVAEIPNSVCGYVVDTDGVEIPGATVQLYGDFPNGTPEMTTTSSDIGSFFFEGVTSVPFDLYAFAKGYYPGKLEDLNFEAKGVKIVLTALKPLNKTSQWVDYFCDENTYLHAPLPVGSVVEAYTPTDLLVGQWEVKTAGSYGFMPVYRANSDFSDDGAHKDNIIRFFINGVQALAHGNTTYPESWDTVRVCLEYGATITKTCTLEAGKWNLVSWNVQTESQSILDVLGPYMNCIDVVLGFEQGGLTYDPTLPEFSTLWTTDHLSGYWIKVKDDCPVTLTLQGLPVPVSTPIPVTTGWNLVSYLPEEAYPPVTALNSISDILLYAYGSNSGNGIQIYQPGSEFNTLLEMTTCHGYWAKVSAPGTLIYPDGVPTFLAVQPRTSTNAVQSLSSVGGYITPTWVNLYASGLKLDGKTVGAGTLIEAHSVTTNAKVGTFTLKSDGKFGFMPVYANADDNNAALVPGGQFYLTVDGTKTKETFTWTSNGDRIQVASLSTGNSNGTLPDGFSLEQNYPNPFNPTTTISFMVPVSTRARIEIYNVLGALIAVPFDDAVEAGEHSIVWDGRNQNGQSVSSGVYLYKLVSDGYSEARKMMLLK
jgi:hypothetical protein